MSIYMEIFIWVTLVIISVAMMFVIFLACVAIRSFTKGIMLSVNSILKYNIDIFYKPKSIISRIRIYDDAKNLNIFVSRLGDGNLRFEQQLDKSAKSEILELSNIGKELDIATNVNKHCEGVLFSAEISGAQNTKLFLRKVLTELFGFQPKQKLWVKHLVGR